VVVVKATDDMIGRHWYLRYVVTTKKATNNRLPNKLKQNRTKAKKNKKNPKNPRNPQNIYPPIQSKYSPPPNKKQLLECANLGHGVTVIGRLYRETDTVLKKLLILIKYC
jgi:hypothetical protein